MGASGEKHLRIDCASEAALIRNNILGLGQCPGVVGHVPDNMELTIDSWPVVLRLNFEAMDGSATTASSTTPDGRFSILAGLYAA